jgi:hypothetical protein
MDPSVSLKYLELQHGSEVMCIHLNHQYQQEPRPELPDVELESELLSLNIRVCRRGWIRSRLLSGYDDV